MRYGNITRGIFIERPNRFIGHVLLEGQPEAVHIRNTGRCRELLKRGAEVWLTDPGGHGRKTKYDLVAVRKENGLLVNIDSLAPNRAVREWLERQGFDRIAPEYVYGGSRIDFYIERGGERFLTEVKGCTLESEGIGYFPDAPTERGVRHIHELIRAAGEGYHAALAFVIQMEGVTEVRANVRTQPAFGEALEEAARSGVEVLCLPCCVEPDRIEIIGEETKSIGR